MMLQFAKSRLFPSSTATAASRSRRSRWRAQTNRTNCGASPVQIQLVPMPVTPQLDQVLSDLQVVSVDRVLLDLGLSSDQLQDTRGFQFSGRGAARFTFRCDARRTRLATAGESAKVAAGPIFYMSMEKNPGQRPIAQAIVESRSRGIAKSWHTSSSGTRTTGRSGQRHPAAGRRLRIAAELGTRTSGAGICSRSVALVVTAGRGGGDHQLSNNWKISWSKGGKTRFFAIGRYGTT